MKTFSVTLVVEVDEPNNLLKATNVLVRQR